MNDLDPEPRIESRIEPGFDPGFDQLYRAASTEQPGAAADAAILALAHAAASETRAAAPVSRLRRWRTPLGLAASLVLAVGIVARVQVEQEAGTAPGSAPAPASSVPASAPASVPSSVPASAPAPAAVSKPAQASEPSSAPDSAQGRTRAPSVAPPSPAQSGEKPEASEKRKALADSVVTAEDSVRKESVTPARESAESKRSQPLASAGAGGAANSASAPAAAAAASSDLSAAAPAPAPKPASAPAPAQSPQPVPLARTAAPAGSTVLNEAIEAALTPEQWLRRIIDARRGGRDDEADASLKRFIAQHPAQPVPPEARRAVER